MTLQGVITTNAMLKNIAHVLSNCKLILKIKITGCQLWNLRTEKIKDFVNIF